MSIDDLENCIAHLLDLARSRGVVRIETGSRDYCWNVLGGEWVNMTAEPKLAVGSLDDDVAELGKFLSDPSRASAADFDRVAALLRLLSDDMSK